MSARRTQRLWLLITVAIAAGGLFAWTAHIHARRVAARPTDGLLFLPTQSPRANQPPGLLIALHCYGCSADSFASSYGLQQLANELDLVISVPQGPRDSQGRAYWNAGSACCDFDGVHADHLGFFPGLIDRIAARVRFDPEHVYLFGFSNGAFLAWQLGCRFPDRFAGLVGVSGTADRGSATAEGRCQGKMPLALSVAGDSDQVVPFGGGRLGGGLSQQGAVVGAEELASAWAHRSGCKEGPLLAASFPLLPAPVAQASTAVASKPDTEAFVWLRCSGAPLGLWRVRGAAHGLPSGPHFTRRALEFLLASWRTHFEMKDEEPRPTRSR